MMQGGKFDFHENERMMTYFCLAGVHTELDLSIFSPRDDVVDVVTCDLSTTKRLRHTLPDIHGRLWTAFIANLGKIMWRNGY